MTATAEAPPQTNGMTFDLQPYQHKFIYSKKRHPAMVGGWAIGKTLCAIGRSRIYSKLIPDNLGVIFRKTAKSLFDSTLRDFEKYTRLKVDSQRNLVDPNGSVTMFRHIDEIGDINQQNINLGWFYIEQGDELETDKEFFMLFGRLRRQLKPTEDFLKLGLPVRSGFVIANAGDHWMRPLWKGDGTNPPKLDTVAKQLFGEDPEFAQMAELVEATTFDNEKNLPRDFIASLKVLEQTKPEVYRQFVMNDWSVSADQYVMIRGEEIARLKGVVHDYQQTKRLISCDPSLGGDACVALAFENTRVVDKMVLRIDDTMKITGELMLFAKRNGNTKNFAIDAIGIGKGIADRLSELGNNVVKIISSEAANDQERYSNRRSELWGYATDLIRRREVEYPEDERIRKHLTAVRYDPKAMNSQGYLKLVPKQDTKKVLNESPDDGDAYVYGLWGLKEIGVTPEEDGNTASIGVYPHEKRKQVHSGAAGW